MMGEPDWKVPGTLAYAERAALSAALEATNFSIKNAAARLRIGRSTIYRLMQRFEITVPARTIRVAAPLTSIKFVPEASVAKQPVQSLPAIVFQNGEYLLITRSPDAGRRSEGTVARTINHDAAALPVAMPGARAMIR